MNAALPIMIDIRTTDEGLVLMLKRPDGSVERQVKSNALTSKELNQYSFKGQESWMISQLLLNARDHTAEHRAIWMRNLETNQMWLQDRVMGPLEEFLSENGIERGTELAIFPSGSMSTMPLGAAFDGSEYFEEKFPFSYGFSDPFMNELARRERELDLSRPFVLANPGEKGNLTWGTLEGRLAAHGQVRYGRHADRQSLVDQGPQTTLLWLTCHAAYADGSPMSSALQLSDPSLTTLGDVIEQVSLSECGLAILSACQTARSDAENLDDSHLGLHLAFLLKGAVAVWGTFWSVDDFGSYVFLQAAYENLTKGCSTVEALRQARKSVREMSGDEAWQRLRELETLLEPHIDDIAANYDGTWRDQYNLAVGRAAMQCMTKERPFAHPFYWAAYANYGINLNA